MDSPSEDTMSKKANIQQFDITSAAATAHAMADGFNVQLTDAFGGVRVLVYRGAVSWRVYHHDADGDPRPSNNVLSGHGAKAAITQTLEDGGTARAVKATNE